MVKTMIYKKVLLVLLLCLFGSGVFSQPQGDYLAVIGTADAVKKVVLFNFEDGTLAYDDFFDLTAYDVGTIKHVIRVGDEFWVSDQTKDVVHRLDIDGNLLGKIGESGGLDNLRGMRIIGDHVWLCNDGVQNNAPGKAIVQLSMEGEILGNFAVDGSPWAIWSLENENALISFATFGSFPSQIGEFSQAGSYLGAWNQPGELNFIQQISRKQNGNYLASSFSNAASGYPSGVHEFNPNGSYLTTVGGTSGGGARGNWELGNGNIMWTNASGIHIADILSGTSTLIYSGQFHYVEKMTFGTSAMSLPFAEDFETGTLPDGWNVYIAGVGVEQWVVTNDQNHTPGGSYAAMHDYGAVGMEDGWLVTPAIGLPEFWDVQLSFWSYNEWPSFYEKSSVLISVGDGNPAGGDFVEIWEAASVSEEWIQSEIDLTAFSGNTVYLAFRYEGDDAHSWFLDDVLIEGAPPMLDPPTNLQATVSGSDVTLTWDAREVKELLGYKIYRNEMLITPTPVSQTTYFDAGVAAGNHFYGVSALYHNGESEKAGPVQVHIQGNHGMIQGFVRDIITNLSISSAMITALNTDNGVLTFSTPFGSHYALSLPPGNYDVTCTADGYQPFTVENMTVIENVYKSYTFYLHPVGGDFLTDIPYLQNEIFILYPNPADGFVNVGGDALKEVQIMNQTGLVILHEKIKYFHTRIDISGLSAGLYFIKVETVNGIAVEKLIVK
jgi:hypothetical protein